MALRTEICITGVVIVARPYTASLFTTTDRRSSHSLQQTKQRHNRYKSTIQILPNDIDYTTLNYLLPHRFQNLHSLASPPLPSFSLTQTHQTGTPAPTNTNTTIVWNGRANTARLSKNRLTQQKMMGVEIQVRYGRSRCGSLIRSTIRPSTVRK